MFEVFRNAVVIGVDSQNPTNTPSLTVTKADGTTVSIWIYKRVDEKIYQYQNGQWVSVGNLPTGVDSILKITSPTMEQKRVIGVIGISNSTTTIQLNDQYVSKYELFVGMTGANNQGTATPLALMAAVKHIDSFWISEALYGMYIFPGIYTINENIGGDQVSQNIIPLGIGYGGAILTINTYVMQILGLLSTIIFMLNLVKAYRNNDLRNGLILLVYTLLGFALTESLAITMDAMLPLNLEYYDGSTIAAASGLIGEVLGLVGYSILTFESDLAYMLGEAMSEFTTGAEITNAGAAIAQAGVQELVKSLSPLSFNPSGVGAGLGAMVQGVYYAMISIVFYGVAFGTAAAGVMVLLMQLIFGWGLSLLGFYIANSTFRAKVSKTVTYVAETASAAALLT